MRYGALRIHTARIGAPRGFLTAVIAAIAFVAGCDEDDGDQREAASPPAAEATRPARCEVGARPDYFVPRPEESPVAVVGCARLGVSRKPVEFSANPERIGREAHLCLNPAFGAGGRLGMYIPAACVRDPVSRRLDVIGTEVPSQGVRGYELVVWGTAAPATRQVVAHYEGGKTAAAVFPVDRPLARAVGAARPFSVFVVEVDRDAPCRVLIRGSGGTAPSAERIGPQPGLCG